MKLIFLWIFLFLMGCRQAGTSFVDLTSSPQKDWKKVSFDKYCLFLPNEFEKEEVPDLIDSVQLKWVRGNQEVVFSFDPYGSRKAHPKNAIINQIALAFIPLEPFPENSEEVTYSLELLPEEASVITGGPVPLFWDFHLEGENSFISAKEILGTLRKGDDCLE